MPLKCPPALANTPAISINDDIRAAFTAFTESDMFSSDSAKLSVAEHISHFAVVIRR